MTVRSNYGIGMTSGSFWIMLATLLLASCSSNPTEQTNPPKGENDTHRQKPNVVIESASKQTAPKQVNKENSVSVPKPPPNQEEWAEEDDQYEELFVVFADTGQDYFALKRKMTDLSSLLVKEIDTMGRYYDRSKDRITLPEDDEDEIYAGDYFMRRFPSDDLSIEYLVAYYKPSGKNTMALMVGIYDDENVADSVCKLVKYTSKRAFSTKAEIYHGLPALNM